MSVSRSSNIELFRIIAMLAIVAHHYVVNSGLLTEVLATEPLSFQSAFYSLFGMWGKTGINCFVLITGYFMCKSNITLRKFLKLYLQVLFYHVVIWCIFIATGKDTFSIERVYQYVMPFTRLEYGFVPCFMAFFLFIPFLNILVNNMTKRQHVLLAALLLFVHTGLFHLPACWGAYNYVTWFVTLYFVASYIRIYGLMHNESASYWGWLALVSVLAAMASVVMCMYIHKPRYMFVADSPAILAVVVSVSSFMFFKNLSIKHSSVINLIASGTFGVLLIHAHSSAMRNWLWRDTVDVIAHYGAPYYWLYAIGVVILVFAVCCAIDIVRQYTLEKPLFARLFDKA